MAHNKIRSPKRNGQYNQNDKVVVKKSLTKTNNISKSNKEPSKKFLLM